MQVRFTEVAFSTRAEVGSSIDGAVTVSGNTHGYRFRIKERFLRFLHCQRCHKPLSLALGR